MVQVERKWWSSNHKTRKLHTLTPHKFGRQKKVGPHLNTSFCIPFQQPPENDNIIVGYLSDISRVHGISIYTIYIYTIPMKLYTLKLPSFVKVASLFETIEQWTGQFYCILDKILLLKFVFFDIFWIFDIFTDIYTYCNKVLCYYNVIWEVKYFSIKYKGYPSIIVQFFL